MTMNPATPVVDVTDTDQHHHGYALPSLPLLRAGFALSAVIPIALVAPSVVGIVAAVAFVVAAPTVVGGVPDAGVA